MTTELKEKDKNGKWKKQEYSKHAEKENASLGAAPEEGQSGAAL